MEYYLQLAGKQAWEKVDEFTFSHWEKALNADDSPRYSGARACRGEGKFTVHADDLSKGDFGILTRFLGVSAHDSPGSLPGGFIREPEFIKFRIGKKTVLREVGGKTWKEAA
jgi:hypothetical protein